MVAFTGFVRAVRLPYAAQGNHIKFNNLPRLNQATSRKPRRSSRTQLGLTPNLLQELINLKKLDEILAWQAEACPTWFTGVS